MIPWYNLTEKERIKKIYSKYSIQSFWDWWSEGKQQYMEVRITNFQLIKEVSDKLNIPYSKSGVYVNNGTKLKNVIALVREKSTVWMGINPRKQNWNPWLTKTFGGGDHFIDSINYIFIDIDRVIKEGLASNKDLANADKLCNLILEKFGTQKWNENYVKIMSGNGIQLIIKLDVPIRMPVVEFNADKKIYINTEEFVKTKLLIKEGIGKQIRYFANKFKNDLQVEVDSSTFNIGRVGALPVTKNFKYDSFRWRGIIELKNGMNIGLTDYILTFLEDVKKFKQNNIFTPSKLFRKNIIRPGKLSEHPLAKFMLENEFSEGGINNTIWNSLKIILRDSNYDLLSKEFIEYHEKLKQKHNRTFTLNIPPPEHKFYEATVNNYCIKYGFTPVYPLWTNRNKKLDLHFEEWTYEDILKEIKYVNSDDIILDGSDIIEDMKKYEKYFIDGDWANRHRLGKFLKAVIEKYGENKAEYYYKNLFYDYFSYQ